MPIVAPTTIPPIPTPVPTTADPANFDARADATLAALPAAIGGMNATAANVYGNATATQGFATAADQSRQTAVDAAASVASAVSAVATVVANLPAINAAPGAATAAAGSASAAAASAAQAGNTLTGTSATSLPVTAGSKTLTTDLNKAWQPGSYLNLARTSAPTTTSMRGTVTAYNPDTGAMTLTVAADDTTGSGTFTDWSLSVAGLKGAAAALPVSLTQTAAFTAVAGNIYPIDSTAGAFTVTMPPTPAAGDTVVFIDVGYALDTKPVTLARNGSKWQKLSEDYVLDVAGARRTALFLNAINGWGM